MTQTLTPSVAANHPLEPLNVAEVAAAAEILRHAGKLDEQMRLMSLELWEPPKAEVLAWSGERSPDRAAFVILRDRVARTTYEAIVSLTAGELVHWRAVPGAQPSLSFDELMACDQLVKTDPTWQAALRSRGVTDFSLTMVDAWSAGYYGLQDAAQSRVVRAITFVRANPTDNGYARPVEGLLTLVDLDAMRVINVEDHTAVPLPPCSGNFSASSIADPLNSPHFATVRTDLQPLEVRQPHGPSFTVEGHAVSWQKWRLRVGFTPREGLVLHQIGYEDRGRLRPIIYRASLAEMVVPYGDPNPTHWRKNAFDEGEYGLGMLADPLELGCDCLGEIHYFDGVLADGAGNPLIITNAICMHEEDFGILWKHRDARAGVTEVRRSRRLVISSIATVGNYEYGFFWYFYQDGSIQYEVKLTGIMSTGAVVPGERPEFGELVAPGLYGPNHQHVFNVRLDFDLDGRQNAVYEVNGEALPVGPQNPHGNAWISRRTLLGNEQDAQRIMNTASGRYWEIANPNVRNAVGGPVAYRLKPGENALPLAQPESSVMQRAGFMSKHLWVTAYDPTQRYAAGDYPNQHSGGAGLPAYAAAGRPLENTDLVVWYTMAEHHVVRPEEWPVMPVGYLGFRLQPAGFFDGNPALDLPPAAQHGDSCCAE